MIVYQLACADGHFFEGWFASGEAYEGQAATGQLECPTCSSGHVHKLPSAPHVHTSSASFPQPEAEPEGGAVRKEAVLALRKLILANTENVGRKFAEIARRIHYKEEEVRGIRGHVTSEEAAELHEEGVSTFSVSAEIIPTEEVH